MPYTTSNQFFAVETFDKGFNGMQKHPTFHPIKNIPEKIYFETVKGIVGRETTGPGV